MAAFLALLSFTDQDIRSVKDTAKRTAAARGLVKAVSINMRAVYWTSGQCGPAVICKGPDDAAMTTFGLAPAAAGSVRSQTLRASSANEMNGTFSKMP